MTYQENCNKKNEIIVFFDGGCPLCRREIEHYQSMRGAEKIKWFDITRNTDRLIDYGINYEMAMSRFHVLNANGLWKTGAYGFYELWKRLNALRWLAFTLHSLHLLPFTDWVYGHFAKRRLKKRCSEQVCNS